MAAPKKGTVPSPDAAAGVNMVVSSLAESWNRHDMTAFAGAFSEDADFVNVVGMHWQGRQEIEAKHKATHRTIFRNSTLQILDQSVRFLGPNVALAHVWTQLQGHENLPGRNTPATRRTIMTCMLVREADRWLITAAHNTDIVPAPFPEA